jgi:hypothetical protein
MDRRTGGGAGRELALGVLGGVECVEANGVWLLPDEDDERNT